MMETLGTAGLNSWVQLVGYEHSFKIRTGPTGLIDSTENQSGSVKTPKTGQQPGKNRGWTKNLKKNGLMSGSVFKTMGMTRLNQGKQVII